MAVADAPVSESSDVLSDWPYRFEIVPLDQLRVDADYQRGLTSFWKTVKEKFNPAQIGTLIVSERAGKKNVVDGQTRLKAMSELGTIANVPCLIYEGLSKKQEALLFALLQTQRRNMTTYERFRAQLVGGDPDAIGIAAICQRVGFELDVKETGHTIRAVAALEKMYRLAPEHLEDVMILIRDIWGVENRDAVSSQILGGMSLFLRTQNNIDEERLRNRLSDVTPKLVINRAAQIREGAAYGGRANRAVSQAILTEYMRRR